MQNINRPSTENKHFYKMSWAAHRLLGSAINNFWLFFRLFHAHANASSTFCEYKQRMKREREKNWMPIHFVCCTAWIIVCMPTNCANQTANTHGQYSWLDFFFNAKTNTAKEIGWHWIFRRVSPLMIFDLFLAVHHFCDLMYDSAPNLF